LELEFDPASASAEKVAVISAYEEHGGRVAAAGAAGAG